MRKENYAVIYKALKNQIQKSGPDTQYIIYPFGEMGAMVKGILNGVFSIQEAFIIDRDMAGRGENIYSIDHLKGIDCSQFIIFFASADSSSYYELRKNILSVCPVKNIVDIFPRTKRGKYSYGPLCDHWLVESVGAFSSFALGTDVVDNHPVRYISTHPFLYCGKNSEIHNKEYEDYGMQDWFFENVTPAGTVEKRGGVLERL